ncbi:interferon-induced, double-stranded RNA-activated protein kinase-like [Dendropsophus ebraccatus]|uniref:interferon-induced, double-stranded RNA-activated protein kinase-like n=1 Tax=Dendropsophus ebraccatus TaxID=150705 RepID=UPI00383222DB
MEEQNYKGMLIRQCTLSGLTFRFDISRTGPSHDPRFTACAFVNEEKYGEGQDKTKKAAENLACKMAFLSLLNRDQGNHELAQPAGNVSSGTQVALHREVASPSPVNGAASNIVIDVNYVGFFNEFCQRNKCLNYIFVDERRGPSHLPEFFCSALIGQRRFPEATGKNKKEAKKNAAHLALKVLKQEYPGDRPLQQIPGLDDLEEAEHGNSRSNSSEDRSSVQKTECAPVQSERSDSLITFCSSAGGTPSASNRTHRRIELAPTFKNLKPVSAGVTKDKIFQQDFDSIVLLDSGSYGTVYKARKKLDNKVYVVKKVKRRSEKDENEIQTLAQLEHKNIVRYYHSWAGQDIFKDFSGRHEEESLFIQMEWCAKGSLERWITSMTTVDKCISLNIFRQIVDGVEYIHKNNLIHRDLKPANILFAEDMTVKIADFGLVTPISDNHSEEALLRTAGCGTESYMAPEQKNKTYENEVDIFPLGLILIELFWIFDNKYNYKEWEKLRNAELPPKFVQRYPSEESIIKLMLSKEPKKRPSATYLRKYFGEKSLLYSKTR